ncbi:MAG: hypothetical protein ABFR02_06470 [Campylobacterota bacterium]
MRKAKLRSLSVLLSLVFVSQFLYAGVAVVPGDEQYYKAEQDNVEMIFTEQNRYAAEQAMALEPMINDEYENSFGFQLDSTLHVGIISQQNQIANGFSTQYPLNMQINYIGGSAANDYFSSTSWLNTLLYHETAHNYQLNPKASSVTRGLHSVLGNAFLTVGVFPLFTVPNVAISSNLLEGNAVLNESWHGNGGRLYSGRFKAETLLQAKAGNINAQFLYNQSIYTFPYYDRHYIVGGFFQLYLAEKYGLKKVNSFFYNHSKSWLWPFRVNHIFEMTFDESYEEALAGFERWLLEEAQGFVEAEGDLLATSKKFTPLNNSCDKIFFLTSDSYRAPELVRLFKKDRHVEKERNSYFQSKLINKHDRYFTQASGFSDPTGIYMGLFDEDGHIKEGTESKMIQGYLKDGVPVYFDIPGSFDQAQLYVGEQFYAQVNSSVYIDSEDNLYYFVQKGKTRTLYKNREAIYGFEGYYGVVSDVDSRGNVYFVANSKKGSSLYRLKEKSVERVSKADNVVDARLVNDEEVLIAAIGRDDYYYVINRLEASEQMPYAVKLFFEEETYFASAGIDNAEETKETTALSLDDPYYEPLNVHYAGTQVAIGAASKNDSTIINYSVSAAFIDPLLTNRVSLFAGSGFDEVGIVGAGYENIAHLLSFGASVYGVYSEGDASTYHLYSEANNSYSPYEHDIAKESRNYGLSAFLALPVIQSGYNKAGLQLRYYQDYDDNARSPLIFSGDVSHVEHYFQAMDNNYMHALELFGSYDRSDLAYGFDYALSHDLPHRFYVSMALKGVRSDFDRNATTPPDADYTRGVKFANFANTLFSDPTTVVMPSLEYTRFVKQAAYGELALKKQFNGRILFFTFPLSLTRELIYAKHRYYDIQDFGQADFSRDVGSGHTVYNESTFGGTFEFLLLNRLPVPVSLEYIHNTNTKEEHNFRLTLGSIF